MPSYDLNGKVALVTGAARGIGYETARQMHMRGASVVLVDLDADQTSEAAERIGSRAIGIGADVTDRAAVMAAVAATVERLGGLDVAVANAGIAPPTVTTARAMPAEEWDRVLDVNLLGACHTAMAALPQISERHGQIVFIGSIYSIANGMLGAPYAISKVGVEALGRALRAELAPFGASATVVYFGWVQTELVRDSLDRGGAGEMLEGTMPRVLLRRISPQAAAEALVGGVERRAPRVFAPRVWGLISALRGLINPLADRYMERDAKVAAAIRQAEAGASGDSVPR